MQKRSKETLSPSALRKCESLLKVHVKSLDDKHYKEDVLTVCNAYKEIFAFLIPLTHRLNAQTVAKMASNVFENAPPDCVAFGRAMADAFSLINGKAQRFVDGSKTDFPPAMKELVTLAVKRNGSDEARGEKHPQTKTEQAQPVVTATSSSSAPAVSNASSSDKMSEEDILAIYGVKPLEPSDLYAEAKRTLKVEKSMGAESIMSINSSAPDSPQPASATASASEAGKESLMAKASTCSEPLAVAVAVAATEDRLPRHNRSAPTDDRLARSHRPLPVRTRRI